MVDFILCAFFKKTEVNNNKMKVSITPTAMANKSVDSDPLLVRAGGAGGMYFRTEDLCHTDGPFLGPGL